MSGSEEEEDNTWIRDVEREWLAADVIQSLKKQQGGRQAHAVQRAQHALAPGGDGGGHLRSVASPHERVVSRRRAYDAVVQTRPATCEGRRFFASESYGNLELESSGGKRKFLSRQSSSSSNTKNCAKSLAALSRGTGGVLIFGEVRWETVAPVSREARLAASRGRRLEVAERTAEFDWSSLKGSKSLVNFDREDKAFQKKKGPLKTIQKPSVAANTRVAAFQTADFSDKVRAFSCRAREERSRKVAEQRVSTALVFEMKRDRNRLNREERLAAVALADHKRLEARAWLPVVIAAARVERLRGALQASRSQRKIVAAKAKAATALRDAYRAHYSRKNMPFLAKINKVVGALRRLIAKFRSRKAKMVLRTFLAESSRRSSLARAVTRYLFLVRNAQRHARTFLCCLAARRHLAWRHCLRLEQSERAKIAAGEVGGRRPSTSSALKKSELSLSADIWPAKLPAPTLRLDRTGRIVVTGHGVPTSHEKSLRSLARLHGAQRIKAAQTFSRMDAVWAIKHVKDRGCYASADETRLPDAALVEHQQAQTCSPQGASLGSENLFAEVCACISAKRRLHAVVETKARAAASPKSLLTTEDARRLFADDDETQPATTPYGPSAYKWPSLRLLTADNLGPSWRELVRGLITDDLGRRRRMVKSRISRMITDEEIERNAVLLTQEPAERLEPPADPPFYKPRARSTTG